MGYNTTVVVLNDALSNIENDPRFGMKLARAIRQNGVSRDRPIDVSAGGHCNAALVVETHHADTTVYVAVGRNYGEVTEHVAKLESLLARAHALLEMQDKQPKKLLREIAAVMRWEPENESEASDG